MSTNKLKYDILSIQDRANQARLNGRKIVNGSAGVLYNDDKSLATYSIVNNKIKERVESYLGYPSVLGSSSYKEGVLKWVFESNLESVKSKFNIGFGATLGGTGAISMTFNYIYKHYDKNVCGIISNIYWPNYLNIAKTHGLELHLHNMIDSNQHFDFFSLEKKIKEDIKKYNHVLVIVNDPCQNPSGFCMDKEEYYKLYELLNKYSSNVSLLLDIAYLDYAPMGFIFPSTLDYEIKFDMFLAFSCSKSFGVYGARVGGLILLVNKSKNVEDYQNIFQEYGRSTYSCPNNVVMGPISEILNDDDLVKQLKQAISAKKERLAKLGKEISSSLDRLHIPYLPYKGGFYLTFLVDDAVSYCKALETKDIYFAPVDKDKVRIAISGLNLEDIKEFERRLKL